MGKQIHLEKVEALFEKSPVVDFKSIRRLVTSNYAKLIITNLLKKGKIKKVGKGIYTKYDESSLAVFAFSPAYIGLQSALSFYGIWEQETIPVILTTKKVRIGLRSIMDSNVYVRSISQKYFFGYALQQDGAFYIPYSDLEKTAIDMVLYNQTMSSEVVKAIGQKMNKEIFCDYLAVCSENTKKKILILFKEYL